MKSDLPFGSEFSPSQINLPELLEIVNACQGDPGVLESTILQQYFSGHGTGAGGARNRKKLAQNCKLGMIAYGIIDRQANFTPFGQSLYDLREDETSLYAELARHILLNLKGMALVQCIQDMKAAAEEVTLISLRNALSERNIHVPSGGRHPSTMHLWLANAGVFVGSRWQVDELRLQEVLGIAPEEYGVLAHFTAEQRAFLRALANTGITDPQPANEIVRLAAVTYGVKFPEKTLPKDVLKGLEQAGYIMTQRTTSGRGAKPFLVTPTAKLITELVEPLLDQLKTQVDPRLLDLLRKPLAEIIAELTSEDRHVSGLALEALAFKLMRFLDMGYVATRLRASTTGGAEVDLIFESARLVFSRWQIQCKNTSRVALDDVAKEVGLTHFLKSNVIVMVSTGDIGGEARRYANRIMKDSNLSIVMIDRVDLESICANTAFIVDAFNREARHAMTLKKIENLGVPV